MVVGVVDAGVAVREDVGQAGRASPHVEHGGLFRDLGEHLLIALFGGGGTPCAVDMWRSRMEA